MNEEEWSLSELPESSRTLGWERYQILRPHLEFSFRTSKCNMY